MVDNSALFLAFRDMCRKRMIKGAETYGNANLADGNITALVEEAQEELADLSNYAAMQWIKLEKLRTRMLELEAKAAGLEVMDD